MKALVYTTFLLTVTPVVAQEFLAATGTVEGVIVRAGDFAGLEGVTVTLESDDPTPATAMTGEDGGFVFADVPPGTYTLRAMRRGFIEPLPGSAVLSILPGQRLTSVRIEMAPASAIAGHVFSASGEPQKNAIVTALRVHFEAGRRLLSPCSRTEGMSSQADENGAFRLYDLQPGQYYLAVGTEEICVTQYYPDTFDPAYAIPLILGVGQEQGGINIQLRDFDRYTVRFTVQAPSLRIDRPGGTVQIVRNSLNGLEATEVYQRDQALARRQNNTYVSPPLPPGSYEMFYSHDGLGDQIAHVTFAIVDRNVDLGTVMIRPGMAVYGQITGEVSGIQYGNLKIDLVPLDARRIEPFFLSSFTRVDPSGTFNIAWPAFSNSVEPPGAVAHGRYQVGLLGLPPDVYLASAIHNGRDVLETGITIDGALSGPLQILVANGTSVEGSVRDNDDQLVAGCRVILVPEARYRGNLNRYKAVYTDQNGRFRLNGVAPGDYLLIASNDILEGSWENGEVLAQLERRGTKLKVDAEIPTVMADLQALSVP